MRKLVVAAAAGLVMCACAGGAQAAVTPYGTDDSGGFRNVLPPGENGLDNAVDLGLFRAAGVRPKHSFDQQGLYQDLLLGSPGLTNAQIPNFFKDATFGVQPGDVESSSSPRPGVTILRDKGYGVPHIYGTTRDDTMFGAGYAGAQDRLFLMDVLRHTGRATLSSFVGGSASNRAMDRTQWALAPYTEGDLQSQIDSAARLYGAGGVRVQQDLAAYVAGINAYIDQTRLDPTKLPAEYAALGKLPEPWKGTDVIATSSLVGGIFGKGGGAEVHSAQVEQAFTKRFGQKKGRKAWANFRSKEDPEASTTVKKKRFPYETGSPFAKRGLAMPDRGSVRDAPVAPPVASASATRASGAFAHIGDQLMRALAKPHASNWELVSKRRSASGHAIGVLGPQVGYYVPQILMEEDMHGPGIDARGAAFPGVNLYVQLGHGRDYAWSATTATSDNVDTFAEVLCGDSVHYLYKGRCLAMEKLDRTNAWSPNLDDTTPAGSETLTAYRTVHGIVYARGTVKGKKVAFASARTTYFHEADSALGFSQLNDPGVVHDPRSFQGAASKINFAFNWGYVDADHIAYYLSGWYPQRAKKTSPDFPVLGTGAYDWKGYSPGSHTMRLIPFRSHPQAIDPPYLVSWNNKQARGWAAADDQYAYGSLARSQMIEDRVRFGTAGKRKMTAAQLVQAMEEPASQDIRTKPQVLKPILRVMGRPKDTASRNALALLKQWAARGGHRRDLNRDGHYDDDAAVTLMDAWWPRLVGAEFRPVMGNAVFTSLAGIQPVSNPIGGAASAPDFFAGWWGYVSKDLRGVLRPKPKPVIRRRHGHKVRRARRDPLKGRYSRAYCGRGSLKRCRAALRASLRQALGVSRTQLYGQGSDCRATPEASCFDENRSTVASGISIPDFPFQNRPTFQQVVEVQGHR
jgi:acyl-homoserine lactone acylase PvdQ